MLAEERRKTDLCFFCPFFTRRALSCRPGRQAEADRQREKMGQTVADSTFFFVILHYTYFYIDTIMYRCIILYSSPEARRETHLCFFARFLPVAPSPAARQTGAGRQAERGKITP